MLPWKTIIRIQRSSPLPVYLQIANAIINEIKNGVIKPGVKMPGTRTIAEFLKLHRQTIVRAYDELSAQGWFINIKSKGTFVNEQLPEVTPRKFDREENTLNGTMLTGYSFKINSFIHVPSKPKREIKGFHDGPDPRIFPVELLTRTYKSVLSRKFNLPLLSYSEVEGRPGIRNAISEYLNLSRGLQTKNENILVTRGTQMALFLLVQVLISKDDYVIAADINYRYADLTFMHGGAKILRVSVDDNGLDVDQIEKICQRKKIRAIYVTSHHHYPTTVTLSAARRMKLLSLAEQYKFIIIEDDYDYEFHYESSPILPLASADRKGMVVYIGSFSKTLAPGIRIGYVSGPANLVAELGKLRQIVDAQGDPIHEQVLAELLNEGEIRRHLKKALKIYCERRDFLCSALQSKLSDVIDFSKPEGGLAIWAKFDKNIPLPLLTENLRKKEIILSNGLIHDRTNGKLNATRMGFGWMNIKETEKAVSILYNTIKK